MRMTLLAFLGLAAACLLAVGTASADSGTFSGSITPTACGPIAPDHRRAGETTIDAIATMDVAANDMTLELFDPSTEPSKPTVTASPALRKSSTRAKTSRPGSGTCRFVPSRAV